MRRLGYKTEDSVTAKLRELVQDPKNCLPRLMLERILRSPQDIEKLLAVYFANRVFNQYRGYLKFGKMNFRIYTKDDGIVFVVKHEW